MKWIIVILISLSCVAPAEVAYVSHETYYFQTHRVADEDVHWIINSDSLHMNSRSYPVYGYSQSRGKVNAVIGPKSYASVINESIIRVVLNDIPYVACTRLDKYERIPEEVIAKD